MNSNKHKTNQLFQLMPLGLLFLLGCFYLSYFTNYIFFYQEKSVLFQVSFDYLREHLNQPGDFLEYLGELQTTFYYYPVLGAVIVALEICGIVFLVQSITKTISGREFYFLPFIIGATLFYLQSNYQYLALNNLGILLQLVLFHRIVRCFKKEYLWIPVVLSPLFYFLFGAFSAIFFGLFLIYFIQKKDWLKLVATLVFTGLFFFVGKEFFIFQTTKTLLEYPFAAKDVGGQVQLFVFAIAIIVLLPLWAKLELKKLTSLSIKNLSVIQLTPFVVVGILAVLVIPRIDKKNSHYFHVEKLFYEQKIDDVIGFNAQFPSNNMLTAFLNNVALAETGRLSNSFFSFPQSPDGGTLFLKWEIISEVLKRGGHFYYSVGMINEAQRWAYEYMVMNGNSPEVLKMMIKTDLIKGKYEIAEKYIAILEKSVFYRNDARQFRELLFDDEAVSLHAELGKKQALDSKQDFFVQADNPPVNLDFIIEADSANFMAIEYKLAWLMLQKDMKGVVNMLPLLEKAGYKRIPKNVEELVVSYKLMRVGEIPKLQHLKVSMETEQRFQAFYKTFQQNQNNKQQAQRALAGEFRDTYWYYVFFG